MIELRVHERIADIAEADWDGLAGPDAPPFLSWTWLDALERTGCAVAERGWLPQHVTLHEEGRLVAAAPAYLKGNSEGEFVFDWAWADLAARLGVDYYPKLLVAVPFTPATSARVLVREGEDAARITRALAQGLGQLVAANELSSAHVLFPTEAEAERWQSAGWAVRHGIQFQWQNAGYATFDEFLATFNAKKRHQIRRERREVRAQGVSIESLRGDALTPEVVDAMYGFYLSTVDKFHWGRRYLNRAFFEEVCSKMGERIDVVLARGEGAKPIAGAFNLVGKDALYGRYWGASEDRPFLHFEVCYYHGVEQCIARGLSRFEPGAGGEHKRARGFLPTVTRSAHLLADARLDGAIRAFVARERAAIDEHVAGGTDGG